MPIPAQCQCGAKFAAPDHLAGKSVACPTCKQPLKIPAQASAPQPAAKQQPVKQQAPAAQADGKIPTQCQCGAKFAAPAHLAGKKVACPQCKQPIQIPAATQPAAAQAPAKQAPAARTQPQPESLPSLGGGIDDLLDEVGVEGKKIGESYCPECGSEFKADALICVQCGYNRKSGRKLSTTKVKKAPQVDQDLSAAGLPKTVTKSGPTMPGVIMWCVILHFLITAVILLPLLFLIGTAVLVDPILGMGLSILALIGSSIYWGPNLVVAIALIRRAKWSRWISIILNGIAVGIFGLLTVTSTFGAVNILSNTEKRESLMEALQEGSTYASGVMAGIVVGIPLLATLTYGTLQITRELFSEEVIEYFDWTEEQHPL